MLLVTYQQPIPLFFFSNQTLIFFKFEKSVLRKDELTSSPGMKYEGYCHNITKDSFGLCM